jgi:RNA polymerase sigma factor (sigma-70 family)
MMNRQINRLREATNLGLPGNTKRFEAAIMSHLSAAYNLARWLTKNEQDAEDIVQESFIRAFQAQSKFRGGDSRSWLLRIVRNTTYTWLRKNRNPEMAGDSDQELENFHDQQIGPEGLLMRQIEAESLRQAINVLPNEFREVVVLRDLEELSYKEIAFISDVPIGTVMSRLARARKRLAHCLSSVEERQQ